MEMQQPRTILVNEHLDVRRQLEQLALWRREVDGEDAQILERIRQLDPVHPADRRLGVQLARCCRLLRLRLVREPLELSIHAIKRASYGAIRDHLAEQFAQLSKGERHLWLINFLFIVTPE